MLQTDLTCMARPTAATALQPAAAACRHCGSEPRASGTGRRSALWWGLGGTLLSGLGWVALMLFDQYNASLAELRNDLKHFHESRADLVKKDTLRKIWEQVKDCFHELQASSTAREAVQRQLQDSERGRRVMARELQRLRERLASVEGRQAAMAPFVPVGTGEH